MRPLSAVYGQMALGACAALGAELFVGFALGFSPGWANGWPGGLSIHRVWSAGMAALLYALMLTAGVGAGGLLGLVLGLSLPNRWAGWVVLAWLTLWTGVSGLTCLWAHRRLLASALAMWPNGYPGGP